MRPEVTSFPPSGFDYEKQELMLSCCGDKWFRDFWVNVPLRQWTSLCFALDLSLLKTEVVQDGRIQVRLAIRYI